MPLELGLKDTSYSAPAPLDTLVLARCWHGRNIENKRRANRMVKGGSLFRQARAQADVAVGAQVDVLIRRLQVCPHREG
eukprot:2676657-Prymnesium_polylepis.1